MLSKLCVGRVFIVGCYENFCNGFFLFIFDFICKVVWLFLCKYYDNILRFFLFMIFFDIFILEGKNKLVMSY